MIAFLVIFNIAFGYYFYNIGLWYLGLIPFLFLMFVLFNFSDTEYSPTNLNIKDFMFKNLYYIAWSVIIFGVIGILSYFQFFEFYYNFFLILTINLIFLIISFLFDYEDGKNIFHFGIYFTILLMFFYVINIFGLGFDSINLIFYIICVLAAFLCGVYAFLFLTLGLFKDTTRFRYLMFLFFNLTVFVFIYIGLHTDSYTSLLFCQLYLTAFYLFVYLINLKYQKNLEEVDNQDDEIDKRKLSEILSANEKIIKPQKKVIDTMSRSLFDYLNNIPEYAKMVLSGLNVLFMFGQIYLFWANIGGETSIFYEIFYWISIGIFFVNFILLKVIDFYYFIQRIFVFFVINFAIYLTILNLFGESIEFIVWIGIGWNVVNSLIIFMSKDLPIKEYLYKEDYYFWIWSNILAMVANVYFVFKLDLDIKLLFSIAALYIGIYGFIAINNFRYINKL